MPKKKAIAPTARPLPTRSKGPVATPPVSLTPTRRQRKGLVSSTPATAELNRVAHSLKPIETPVSRPADSVTLIAVGTESSVGMTTMTKADSDTKSQVSEANGTIEKWRHSDNSDEESKAMWKRVDSFVDEELLASERSEAVEEPDRPDSINFLQNSEHDIIERVTARINDSTRENVYRRDPETILKSFLAKGPKYRGDARSSKKERKNRHRSNRSDIIPTPREFTTPSRPNQDKTSGTEDIRRPRALSAPSLLRNDEIGTQSIQSEELQATVVPLLQSESDQIAIESGELQEIVLPILQSESDPIVSVDTRELPIIVVPALQSESVHPRTEERRILPTIVVPTLRSEPVLPGTDTEEDIPIIVGPRFQSDPDHIVSERKDEVAVETLVPIPIPEQADPLRPVGKVVVLREREVIESRSEAIVFNVAAANTTSNQTGVPSSDPPLPGGGTIGSAGTHQQGGYTMYPSTLGMLQPPQQQQQQIQTPWQPPVATTATPLVAQSMPQQAMGFTSSAMGVGTTVTGAMASQSQPIPAVGMYAATPTAQQLSNLNNMGTSSQQGLTALMQLLNMVGNIAGISNNSPQAVVPPPLVSNTSSQNPTPMPSILSNPTYGNRVVGGTAPTYAGAPRQNDYSHNSRDDDRGRHYFNPSVWKLRFDGTNFDLGNYLDQFLVVANRQGWDDEEKGAVLIGSLEGIASKIMSQLPKGCTSFTVIAVRLKEMFSSEASVIAYRTQFQCRSRGPSESCQAFAMSLMELAHKGYPQLGFSTVQQLLVDRFISGQSQSIRFALAPTMYSTLESAVAATIRLETLAQTQTPPTNVPNSSDAAQPQQPQKGGRNRRYNASVAFGFPEGHPASSDGYSYSTDNDSGVTQEQLAVDFQESYVHSEVASAQPNSAESMCQILALIVSESAGFQQIDAFFSNAVVRGGPRSPRGCFYCDRPGHMFKDCRILISRIRELGFRGTQLPLPPPKRDTPNVSYKPKSGNR